MDRNLSQRIRNVEKLLSKAEEFVSLKLKKREEDRARFEEGLRPRARLHATAVAAIVMYGKPRIDEPLIRAWIRTLRQHGIIVRNEYGREYEYEHGHEREYEFKDERELKIANAELYPAIMKGANETEKFTEIFGTAPVWLLEFTWMRLDAGLLKFDLPEMSDKQVWGEQGLRDLLRWPLLPLGRMTDGDLVPEVAPEEGVSPKDEERSRQHRRISELIDRLLHSSRLRNSQLAAKA
jgi:hypothetical protein